MLNGDEPVLGPRIHRLVSDVRLRWSALDERSRTSTPSSPTRHGRMSGEDDR